jgi:hypothetical protein
MDNTVSVEEPEATQSLKVYPNPAVDLIHVLDIEQKNVTSVEVFNMQSQSVLKQAVQAGDKVEIPVEHLAPGVYIVLMKTKSGSAYQSRFVKQ